MPFASNWTEELVAEWLQLENYLVVTRLPSVSANVGGRYEPDIVGGRVDKGTLKILHCEVTSWLAGNATNTTDRYANKFLPKVCQTVTEHFRESFGIVGQQPCTYEKWVIAGGFSKPMEHELRNKVSGVQLYRTDDFIRNKVLPSIKAWGNNAPSHKTAWRTLPQGLWLLQLLDYMDWGGLIK